MDGLRCTHVPSKQRGHVRSRSFLIPRVEPFYGIFEEYFQRVKKDLDIQIGDEQEFLWTGYELKGKHLAEGGQSSFKGVKSPVGKNEIYGAFTFVAKRIGRPDAVMFTSHSGRRTSATWQGDEGASHQELQAFVSLQSSQVYLSL